MDETTRQLMLALAAVILTVLSPAADPNDWAEARLNLLRALDLAYFSRFSPDTPPGGPPR